MELWYEQKANLVIQMTELAMLVLLKKSLMKIQSIQVKAHMVVALFIIQQEIIIMADGAWAQNIISELAL